MRALVLGGRAMPSAAELPPARPGVDTRRRRLLAAAALGLVAPAGAVSAPPRIGYLSTGRDEEREVFLDALRDSLRELGWVDGRNIVIDVRWVGPRADRFPEAASDAMGPMVGRFGPGVAWIVVIAVAAALGVARWQHLWPFRR